MTGADASAAELISSVWVEWHRVFNCVTPPVLIPVRVVPIPAEVPEPKPVVVVFASDADFSQINRWRSNVKLLDISIDITFNGYVNETFSRLRLTGFSAVARRGGQSVQEISAFGGGVE